MTCRLATVFLASVLASGLARSARAETGTTPIGGACKSDAECAVGSICTPKKTGGSVCTALPNKKTVVPFYFHQPGDVGYRHIVPILYFSSWDRKGSTRVQFPFFAHTRDYKAESTTTIVPPLLAWVGTYKGGGEQVGLMPLVYWKHHGPEKWLVLPPLLSGGRSDKKEDLTEAVVLLAGYYRRHHDDTWRVLFPLLFDHQTAKTRTTLAPLGWFHRDERHRTDVVFPLVWHFTNHEKGTNHLTLFPLFQYTSDRFGGRARLFSPLAIYERNDETQLKQLALTVPIFYYRRDPLRDVDVFPPVFTRWKVHDDGSSGLIAGPFLYASDPKGSTTSLLPIYWRFHDRKGDAETQFLFPVAGFHRHPGAAGAFVGPIYGWRSKNGEGSYGGGVAPILFFGKAGPKRHAVVAPVFAHWADTREGSSTTAVGLGFYHRVADAKGGGFDAGLFPALFFGKRAGSNYALVPPVFFHKSGPEGGLDIVGPVYVRRTRTGYSGGLFPLAFFGRHDGREHQVILPPLFMRFVDRERRTERTLIGPYYHGRDGDARVDALFPLFYLKRAPGEGLLISPLAGWRKDPKKKTETIIVGLYGYQRNDKRKARTHFLFPFGAVHDEPGYHVVAQFPFFWQVREGDETDTTVFPFYWRIRSPRTRVDAVFPVGFHAETRAASTTMVGPFWYRARKDGGRSASLFPLFVYAKSKHEGGFSSWLALPGVYWDKSEARGTSNLVVGPFYRATSPDGYQAGLVPLAFAWRHGTASKVVTPIFYRQADPANDYALNVLGPLYWGHKAEGRKRFGLFPLVFASWDRETASAGVFPLFYFHKKPLGHVFATPIFGWSRYPTGAQAYVGPFYVRKDQDATSAALFPIAWFTRNHVTGARTDMVLPLYFDGRTEDGREVAMYSPLLWRFKTIERQVFIGLPLFFDVHAYGEDRSTGFLPLFIRHRSNVSRSTSWFFPPILTWARNRHGEDPGKDVVVFPLVWRFGGKDSSTVVAPLFWDFKRGDARTTIMFPVFTRVVRSTDTHMQILNLYYRRGTGPKEGSWYCDIFPVAQFGHPRKGDLTWKVLEGLFGYSRLGRNRILHLFWVLDVPLEPLPASSLTWFGSTPTSARTEF